MKQSINSHTMPEEYKYNEEITDYLYNDMTEQEKADFEQRMAQDSDLAAEVERIREMINELTAQITYEEVMNDPNLEWARETARKIQEEADNKSKKEPVPYTMGKRALHYLLAAATFALMALIGNQIAKDPDAGRLFAEHYNPYPVEQPAINTETPNGEILAQGIRNYNRGNYIQVIAALTELEKQENPAILPPESTFTLGLAYLAVQDYPNAIKTFREHLDNKKEYQDQVRWYLGLAYLREDNPAEARQVLSGLTATDNEYTKKATRLNKKIEKMMD